MQKGFWDNLSFPIVGLSPMDGVTDAPMRFITKKYGKVDIVYTEFVSAEGLWRIRKKGDVDHKIWRDLVYDEAERPVIAQLFGSDPDSFFEAAKIVCGLGFDGIDINMGCPSPGLEKRGGGAGLIRDHGLAAAVIEAARRGVIDFFDTVRTAQKSELDLRPWSTSADPLRAAFAGAPAPAKKSTIPVSVKTRIGSTKPDENWWRFLADRKLPAVAMHGRTFKQLYKGEADWDSLLRASEIIRESGAKFLGNGDVKEIKKSRNQELKIVTKLGKEIDLTGKMDGVLIGREAIGNPWVLRKDGYVPTIKEKLKVVVEHAKKFEEIFKKLKNSKKQKFEDKYLIKDSFQFFPMRKHLASYVKGFEGSVGLRKKLMTAIDAEQVEMLVVEYLGTEER